MAKTPRHGKLQKGKVTIFDVAAQAGVSIKTVSRVVNNEPHVRPQTKKKVLEAVERLRYRPNAAARTLSGRRSWVLGLVYENPHEFSYMKDVLNGALSLARPGSTPCCCARSPCPARRSRSTLSALSSKPGWRGSFCRRPWGTFPRCCGCCAGWRFPSPP